MKFGGFPEPFLNQSTTFLKKWTKERRHRVIYEDLRDLQKVKEISYISLLVENLPDRIGSPLSIQSIKEDLSVSHQAVDRWISLLELLYMVFRISPFGSSKIKAVKKEQKLYFFDWSHIQNKGVKFENLVASHLLKFCHYHEDVFGEEMELRFLRDINKREVDFIVIKNKKTFICCRMQVRRIFTITSYKILQRKNEYSPVVSSTSK